MRLAEKLQKNGFEVIIDRTHLEFGYDKYAFMERMVTDPAISKVFIDWLETNYHRRAIQVITESINFESSRIEGLGEAEFKDTDFLSP